MMRSSRLLILAVFILALVTTSKARVLSEEDKNNELNPIDITDKPPKTLNERLDEMIKSAKQELNDWNRILNDTESLSQRVKDTLKSLKKTNEMDKEKDIEDLAK